MTPAALWRQGRWRQFVLWASPQVYARAIGGIWGRSSVRLGAGSGVARAPAPGRPRSRPDGPSALRATMASRGIAVGCARPRHRARRSLDVSADTCASPAPRRCPTASARRVRGRWSTTAVRSSRRCSVGCRRSCRRPSRPRTTCCSLTASGTGGLEAIVVNHLSPGDPVLSVSIGVFGDRIASIATTYGADVTKSAVEWGAAAQPDRSSLTHLRAWQAAGRPPRPS